MQKTFGKGCLLASAAGMAIVCSPVAAQEASEGARASEVDTIIVTARRVEERLQDVPASITVFDQDQLTKRNIVTGVDLASYTPSLSVNTQYGAERAVFSIRGFVQEPNTAPSVGVYFADVTTPRGSQTSILSGGGAGPGRFFDLQNVQVLKGPQGTLFGRNTTGGAILIVPQKPTDFVEGYVEGSIGNYDMRRFQGVLNVPLADTFKVRLGFDRQVRDGYLRNVTGIGPDNFNDIDYWAARLSIVMDITPDFENYIVANYSNSDTNGALQKTIACAPGYNFGDFACGQLQQGLAEGDGYYDVRQNYAEARSLYREWQIVDTATWQASDNLTVKNIASYGELFVIGNSSLFGTNFFTPPVPEIPGVFPGAPSLPLVTYPLTALPGRGTADQWTFTEELQFQGEAFGGRMQWQAGGYYEKSGPMSPSGQTAQVFLSCEANFTNCRDIFGALTALNFGLPPGAIQVGSLTTTANQFFYKSMGLYGQASFDLTDQLTVTAGARYTWDRQRVISTAFLQSFAYDVPLPVACVYPDSSLPDCTIDFRQKSDAPTWMIDLEYKPTPDLMLYVKYARGYRTGGITQVLPEALATYQPEKVESYEAGIKSEFRGAVSGYINLTGFYNDFSDQQLSLSLTDNPAVPGTLPPQIGIINAGKSRLWGIELEASISPFEGMRISGSYAYLNTEVQDIIIPDTSDQVYLIDSNIVPGDPLLQTPRNKFSVTASYTLPLSADVGEISFGATFTHTDKQRTNFVDRNFTGTVLGTDLQPITGDLGIVPAIDLLNLNFDWTSVAGSPFDLSIFATNVTNEKYYSYAIGTLPAVGLESVALGEPRMYGARIRFNF